MSSPDSPTSKFWSTIVASVWVVVFLIHFFRQDLPNNSTAEAQIERADVWQLIQQDWPTLLNPLDYSSREQVDAGWAFLGQRIRFVAVAALLWLSSAAIGFATIGRWLWRIPLLHSERIVLSTGIGLSLFSLWILVSGICRQLSVTVLSLPIVVCLVVLLWQRITSTNSLAAARPDLPGDKSVSAEEKRKQRRLVLLLSVPMTVFCLHIFLGGMTPPFDFDVREYHLQGPKEWFQSGQITTLNHNVYTSFPFLSEMFSLGAMVFHNDWWAGAITGKLTLAGFQFLTALTVYAVCRRHVGFVPGLIAAIAFLSTPWVTRISIIAYAEGAITFYVMAAAAAALMAIPTDHLPNRRRLTAIAGFLAGSAMASKYPGLVSAVIPVGLMLAISFRQRIWRDEVSNKNREILKLAGIYTVCVVAAIGPWMLKNAVATGNPVYPLAYGVFGGSEWDDEMDAKWSRAHSPSDHDVSRIPAHLHSVVTGNDWQSGLLCALGVPTLLLLRRETWMRWVWLHAFWLVGTWWLLTHRIDRFWIPVIPLLAVLVGAAWTIGRSLFWKTVVVSAVGICCLFNYAFCRLDVVGFHVGLMDLKSARNLRVRQDIRLLNSTLPKDACVLMVGEAQVFDCHFKVIYNTVFDDNIFEEWTAQPRRGNESHADRKMKSADEIRAILDQQQVTHIFVNWSEVLRYRMTYGYTEYVVPARFNRLQEIGVVDPPSTMAMGRFDTRSPSEQKQILSWPGGASLKQGVFWKNTQLYRIR